MATNAWQAYQETGIAAADPLELVEMLYRGAIEAAGRARAHLRAGAIAQRSREIMRACEILLELEESLDYERGGELSRNLARLYVYMRERLLEANTRQIEAPLQEVESLLAVLLEGWQECRRATAPAPEQAAENEHTPLAYSF